LRGAYAVHRPVVNAFLERERARRQMRGLAWVIVAVVPLGAALIAYTWMQHQTLVVSYKIERLEREKHELGQRERQLRLEAAHLAHPGLLAERAQKELGLAPPAVEQVIFLEETR
jgi:cell division protein FtsL